MSWPASDVQEALSRHFVKVGVLCAVVFVGVNMVSPRPGFGELLVSMAVMVGCMLTLIYLFLAALSSSWTLRRSRGAVPLLCSAPVTVALAYLSFSAGRRVRAFGTPHDPASSSPPSGRRTLREQARRLLSSPHVEFESKCAEPPCQHVIARLDDPEFPVAIVSVDGSVVEFHATTYERGHLGGRPFAPRSYVFVSPGAAFHAPPGSIQLGSNWYLLPRSPVP